MTSETETYKRMSNENISSANNDHIDNKELGDRSAQSSATSAEVDLEYGTEKERGQDEAPRDGQSAPVGPSGPPAGHPPGALPAPPDGGMKAWLQVIGGYCLFFNTWGLLNTFGVRVQLRLYVESPAVRFHAPERTKEEELPVSPVTVKTVRLLLLERLLTCYQHV